jgi:hypothetical protein
MILWVLHYPRALAVDDEQDGANLELKATMTLCVGGRRD